MTTQREEALKGNITQEVEKVALAEKFSPEEIRQKVARGVVAIPANPRHKNLEPRGVGEGLSTKVNANFGTSRDCCDIGFEMQKLESCLEAGADAVMDLSTAGDLDAMRREVIRRSTVPVGTVPIYQALIENKFDEEGIFEIIERQAEDGVDFITVHCGVNFESLNRLKKHPRVIDVVSRGGAVIIDWIQKHKKENPLYAQFDRLLEIARKYDVTLSLGDGLRPGCLADATDRAQIQELITLGELTKRAWEAGVQVMIEGPGHVPIDQIQANIILEKKICQGAPFYVLGPLPTDLGVGYDHVTSAIGGALAATAGADFLCYVTRSEHLGLPSIEEAREAVVVCRIAAHIADIAKGVKGAKERDLEMAKARRDFDWDKQFALAIDPVRAREMRLSHNKSHRKECSMCSEFCSMRIKVDKE
ncbi:MAG: phosphomethylpyrimidine synthase ThiC [Candidatus Saganbacteria bacterium]|nr:phosphomethylpyrimidine synthase ThiC [Candidatus Saganbacteria bacterium]